MLIPILTALFRHHRLFLYTMTLSFALILSLALVTKKQYRSEMKFLVQNARSTALLSSDRTSSSIVNGVTEEQLNSELEILQSEDVLSAVADPNWNPADVDNRSRQEVRAHVQKVATLSSHLTVDPIAKEDIMSISFMADSPQRANDVLTALSAAYLMRHERLRRPTGASSFFVEQAKLYDDDLKAATQKLVDFQQLHHLANVPEVEDSLQRSILAGEEAFRNIQLKLRESNASIGGAQSILAGVAPRQQTQQRVVPSELLLQQLKTSLVSLNNRRTELLNRYQPTDRLVTEVDDQRRDFEPECRKYYRCQSLVAAIADRFSTGKSQSRCAASGAGGLRPATWAVAWTVGRYPGTGTYIRPIALPGGRRAVELQGIRGETRSRPYGRRDGRQQATQCDGHGDAYLSLRSGTPQAPAQSGTWNSDIAVPCGGRCLPCRNIAEQHFYPKGTR
jgi:hypothetical protein